MAVSQRLPPEPLTGTAGPRCFDKVLVNFKALLQPFETEVAASKAIRKRQAEQRRAKTAAMTTAPLSLKQWTEDDKGSTLLQEWLRLSRPAEDLNCLQFLKVVLVVVVAAAAAEPAALAARLGLAP